MSYQWYSESLFILILSISFVVSVLVIFKMLWSFFMWLYDKITPYVENAIIDKYNE